MIRTFLYLGELSLLYLFILSCGSIIKPFQLSLQTLHVFCVNFAIKKKKKLSSSLHSKHTNDTCISFTASLIKHFKRE